MRCRPTSASTWRSRNATGNRYFADIMSHLGATLIPRARINSSRVAHEELPQYLRRVNREHEQIYSAIARSDAESARAAMRIHLTNSRERLRRAQEAAQAAVPPTRRPESRLRSEVAKLACQGVMLYDDGQLHLRRPP